MKKTLVIISAILVIVLPLAMLLGLFFYLPPQYTNTFVGELDNKFDRLMEIDEPKIVIVGGSSVAFGTRRALRYNKGNIHSIFSIKSAFSCSAVCSKYKHNCTATVTNSIAGS